MVMRQTYWLMNQSLKTSVEFKNRRKNDIKLLYQTSMVCDPVFATLLNLFKSGTL